MDESRRLGEERLSRGDPAGAAAEFERGSHFLEASLAWERGGDPARAFENLLRVTPADTRYRQACVRAIRLAPARGPLSLGFENLVARFVKLGPENGEETEAFLALASLYEREGFVENATEALERVVARSPQHGAAQAALQRLRAPAPPPPPELPLDLPPPLERQRRQITPPKESRETQEEMPFRVGATIAGRYRLEEKIGAGGMSVVFRALDQQLNDDVAVKVFTQAVFDAESDGRLRRELSLSRLLSHPNIVQLFAIGLAFGFRYVTLELLRGVELASRMRGTALPLAEGLDYLMQACAGLQAAHDQGIVHRDVKREICVILASGQLKLMDFGIAKVRDAAGLTATGMVAGTPAYMAPEQVLSFSSVTASADQYSLGIMAFEMFTAMRPFRHDEPVPLMMMHANEPPPPPRSINPSLPPELERIILRCLEKDPQRRYTSCRELRGELAAVRRSG